MALATALLAKYLQVSSVNRILSGELFSNVSMLAQRIPTRSHKIHGKYCTKVRTII